MKKLTRAKNNKSSPQSKLQRKPLSSILHYKKQEARSPTNRTFTTRSKTTKKNRGTLTLSI